MGCLDFCTVSADQFVPAYQRWENHPARQEWEPIQDLGSGSFSQVVLARHISTGALAALKVVFLNNPELDPETEAMLAQEGDLLLHLSHPNLVSCSQVIRSPSAHVLVLEYLRGCNVLDGLYRISETYTERDAWSVFHQLASAVAYLHSRSVIHRDIKPENLVYASKIARPAKGVDSMEEREKQEAPIVKLVDLGMAWRFDSTLCERGVLGSAGFVAPEIIKGGEHTPAMDVFAMGVLLFIMLVGRKPFNIEDSEKLKYAKMALADAPGLKDPRWLDLSPDAKHLLMCMLTFDPERRLTAAQVLEHEWVTTKGGRVLRMLGMDVALGAATVAEMRRLKFLCNGVVAMRRVAVSMEEENSKKKKKQQQEKSRTMSHQAAAAAVEAGSCREHAYYLDELRRMQRREASVRNGGNQVSLRGMARTITAASYRHIHDTGGSVHKSAIAFQAMQSASSNPECGDVPVPKASTGMRRSGTALLLSEVLAPAPESERSVHGRSMHGNGNMLNTSSSYRNGHNYQTNNSGSTGGMSRSASGLFLLGASLRQYMDVSIHGGGAHGNSNSSAGKLLSNGSVAPEEKPSPSIANNLNNKTDFSPTNGFTLPPPPQTTVAAPKGTGKTTLVKAEVALASPPVIKTIVSSNRRDSRDSFDYNTPLTPNGTHYDMSANSGERSSRTSIDDDYLKIIQVKTTVKDGSNGLEKKLHGAPYLGLHNGGASSPTYGTGGSSKSNRSGSAGRRVHSVKPLDG